MLRGGAGGDHMYGGPGRDHMKGGPGHDVVRRGSGQHSSVSAPPTTVPAPAPLPVPGGLVVPQTLVDDLCAALSQILTPLPAQSSGLPPAVIAQLPPAITTQIPADLLQIATLNCPTPSTTG